MNLADVNTAQLGLPRPVAEDRLHKLRPVPWTQKDGQWGVGDSLGRLSQAQNKSLCLVCGEKVDEGLVFWDKSGTYSSEAKEPIAHAAFVDLSTRANYIADGAPLHVRCAKITRAHCRTIRERFASGQITLVPYTCEDLDSAAQTV